MITTLNQKQAAPRIFNVLADLYKEPDLNLWEEIKSGKLMNDLHEYVEVFQATASLEVMKEFPEEFEQWKRGYTELLQGGLKESVVPVESIFKIWTNDDSCGMPFAKSKGYLLGDSAMHIRFLLNEFELEIPEDYRNTPDHLSILLELLAYFIENAPVEFTKQFMEDHFDWLGEFAEELEKKAGKNFYYQMTKFLEQMIEIMK